MFFFFFRRLKDFANPPEVPNPYGAGYTLVPICTRVHFSRSDPKSRTLAASTPGCLCTQVMGGKNDYDHGILGRDPASRSRDRHMSVCAVPGLIHASSVKKCSCRVYSRRTLPGTLLCVE